MTIVLDKIGADPEAAVVADRAGLISALDALHISKEEGLQCFVGVDGHASTAELRPPPSRNILRLLFSLAEGVDVLWQKAQALGAAVVARPYVLGETLGGHIHVSFTQSCPELWDAAYKNGLLPVGDELFISVPSNRISVLPGRTFEDETAATPEQMLKAFRLLSVFLEPGIQPCNERAIRLEMYGNSRDIRVVLHGSPRPLCHLQYEYRIPSTWLIHPRVAYAYLALAKLSMLNFSRLATTALVAQGDCLVDLQRVLKALGALRRTHDLRFLEPTLEWLIKNKEALWDNYSIWTTEWRKIATKTLPQVPNEEGED